MNKSHKETPSRSFAGRFHIVAKRHCPRVVRATRARVLIDAAAYYTDLAARLRHAERLVWIIGWDLNSRIVLEKKSQNDKARPLAEFLETLLVEKPGLHIYVLVWKSPVLFGLKREQLLTVRMGIRSHPRLHFHFDEQIPAGGSHHQKLVVIDDATAYCGGIDLAPGRWDTPDHASGDPRRFDPDGESYGPFHDCMIRVEGEAAAALGEVARERWRRSLSDESPVFLEKSIPFEELEMEWDFENVRTGIVRTCPAFQDQPEILQTRNTCLDMIRSARKLVYIENQYFTYQPVMKALMERLEDPHGPEIVVILSEADYGFLESTSMMIIADYWISRLSKADSRGRFGVFHPVVPGISGREYTTHIKLLMVDDDVLLIGSANLNARSMGLDTECGVVIEAEGRDAVRRGIVRIRNRLIAEHLAMEIRELEKSVPSCRGILGLIRSRDKKGRFLKERPVQEQEAIEVKIAESGLLDPEKPADFERMADTMSRKSRPIRARIQKNPYFVLGIAVGILIAISVLWTSTPLSSLMNPDTVGSLFETARGYTWTPVLVIGLYIAASVLFIPLNLLILATAGLFSVPWAFFYVLVGSAANALAGYYLGRRLGENFLKRHFSQSVEKLSAYMKKKGILSIFLVRSVPVAPFSTINFLCGAYRINITDYLAGSVLGILPGTTAIILFEKSLSVMVRDFNWKTTLLFFLVFAAILSGALWMHRRFIKNR